MIGITKKLIKYNFSKGGNHKKYIVIHDTGNYKNGAGAINHFKYFNGGNRGASAHYFVDDKTILQVVEDDDVSWHSGVKYSKEPPRKEVNNRNSIGIEMCVNYDSDYNKAFENTVELTKYLMEKYNIKEEDVVRHYDATSKNCPMSMNENDWAKWKEFKAKLVEEKGKDIGLVTYTNFEYEGEKVTVSRILHKGENYVKVKDLNKLGLNVLWDSERRIVVIEKK